MKTKELLNDTMTTKPDDPAFPVGVATGLTKRELFTLYAMEGIISGNSRDRQSTDAFIAIKSRELANALIAAFTKERIKSDLLITEVNGTNPDDPAFPVGLSQGVTKHELFAARAMRAFLAGGARDRSYGDQYIALRSVQIADAMIEASIVE